MQLILWWKHQKSVLKGWVCSSVETWIVCIVRFWIQPIALKISLKILFFQQILKYIIHQYSAWFHAARYLPNGYSSSLLQTSISSYLSAFSSWTLASHFYHTIPASDWYPPLSILIPTTASSFYHVTLQFSNISLRMHPHYISLSFSSINGILGSFLLAILNNADMNTRLQLYI